jgi:membrane protein DedA with SNARE-associated domain
VINWHSVDQITGYGYFGGFVVSALGGGTVFVPIPMAAVQFTLGGLLPPPFGPLWLGPLLVGLICSLGESLGSVTIYLAGVSGASFIPGYNPNRIRGRLRRAYDWLSGLIQRRGALIMFAVSCVMNPFFVPVALSCGATRLGTRRYFLAVFAGKFIKVTVIAYAGYFGLQALFKLLGIQL